MRAPATGRPRADDDAHAQWDRHAPAEACSLLTNKYLFYYVYLRNVLQDICKGYMTLTVFFYFIIFYK